MKYVNRVVKDGVEYLYFRKAGLPSVRLKSPMPPEDEEEGSVLEIEVKALLSGALAKALPSSLAGALKRYERSARYLVLGDDTKYEYGLIIKELDADLGNLPCERFVAEYVFKLQEVWAKRGHRAAENRLLILRHALLPSMIAGKLGGDPFAMLPPVPRSREAGEPHKIWPVSVVLSAVQRALKEGKVGLARGIAIGRYAGARRGDIVKMTRRVRKNGRISWLSGKRRVPVDIAEDAALTAVLASTPDHPRSVLLAYNVAGLAYTEDGLGQEIGKIITDLFTEGEIDTDDYNLHGLRHTFGVEAALSGCTDAEGAARMGHRSPNSFARYRRQADRIRLSEHADAKVQALREGDGGGGVQNELQKICQTAPAVVAKARGKN